MTVSHLSQLRQLHDENAKLKRMRDQHRRRSTISNRSRAISEACRAWAFACTIKLDNGSESISKVMDKWAY